MHDYDYHTKREVKRELSARAYNFVIGLVLLWGFAINIVMCTLFQKTFLHWNFAVVVVGYFISAFAGVFISKRSSNPFISFIGYNLVVLPVGVVLSIGLAGYDSISILNAIIVTAIVTIVMILLSTIFPNIFLSMGKVLFVALSVAIICELVFIFLGIITPSLWDFLVALIFCGYIGYDWAEAQKMEHTLDNAVDSVVGLYLDIVNLFLRILEISSKND